MGGGVGRANSTEHWIDFEVRCKAVSVPRTHYHAPLGQTRYAAMAISVGAGVTGAIGVTDTPGGRQLCGKVLLTCEPAVELQMAQRYFLF